MATLAFKSFGKAAVQKFIEVKCIQDDVDEEELINEELWENEDFDVCVFDEDKMMTHMLDCYAALCSFQQYRGGREQSNQLDAKTQQTKNKAFKIAMSLMSRGMTHDDAEEQEDTSALSNFVTMFPDDTKHTDGRGWMPLHWATLALGTPEGDGLVEEDVKLIYAVDPPALQRFHDSVDDDEDDPDRHRYTPVHFLCVQPVTPLTMSLLRYFSMCNLSALISSSYVTLSVLHAVCQFGQPTEELLQHLLQLDSSQVTKECGEGCTPLQYLCQNKCCNERLMNCLLQFDSSAAVVGGSISACITSKDHASILEKVDTLLKVNPEAALHHSDSFFESSRNFLHVISSKEMPSALCIDVMKRILVLYPDAVKEVNSIGELPIHIAAKRSSLEVMEFLLNVYPESATIVTVGKSENLLHLATEPFYNLSMRGAKIRYLCSRFPEFIRQRKNNGETPFHIAVYYHWFPTYQPYQLLAAKILCEIGGGQELARMPNVHPTPTTNHTNNGWLPLHYFVTSDSNFSSPLSEKADFYRLLLRWHPEAAGIEAGNGRLKMTPYQLAVASELDPYYLRLLLRAAPALNPAELHRFNYAERRMAMFMAFRAVTAVTVLVSLCGIGWPYLSLVW